MPRMTQTFHDDAEKQNKPDRFVGKRYFHAKSQCIYRVTGYRIDSQRELWLLDYEMEDKDDSHEKTFSYAHTIADFTREGRFIEVKS